MDHIPTAEQCVGKELDKNKNQHPHTQTQHQPQRQEQYKQQEITEQSQRQHQQSKRNKLVRTTESLGNTFSAALKVQQAKETETTTKATADAGANSIEPGYPTTNKQQSTASTSLNDATNASQRLKDGSADVMGGGFPIRPLTATSAIAVKHFKQQQRDLEKAIVAIEATTTTTTIKTKQKSSPAEEAKASTQMKEKLLENIQTENVEQQSDKVNKNKDEDKVPNTPTKTSNARPTSIKGKNKPSKESRGKFAEKLRRSFRRGEHKSLEIKRREPSFEGFNDGSRSANHTTQGYSPDAFNSSCNSLIGGNHFNFGPFGLRSQPPLQRSSQSIFSLTHLPGISGGGGVGGGVSSGSKSSLYSTTSGGHINPALLLDSPDVDTPPEYAYHHLSSVATTNSSTSLESNFGDIGERTSSQSSISYWALHQSNSSMGGEVSTNNNSGGAGANGTTGIAGSSSNNASSSVNVPENRNLSDRTTRQHHTKLQTQSSSKSDTQHQEASRSCSINSESSSTKLTRLQNFLFKSSNESTRSFRAHSNEGFTASSQYSSSGEWENLGFTTTSGSGSHVPSDFYVGSFPEETNDGDGSFVADPPTQSKSCSSSRPILKRADSSEAAGSYYQYTLTSPNNPFLPEIIARSYHSSHEEENEIFDSNVTAVKYSQIGDASAVSSGIAGGGTQSAQLPTPAYSRAGSQESTHSDSAIPAATSASSCSPAPHTSSPASSSSSTPGRQRRKLFILNSPTRHLLHQQPSHKQPQQQQQQQQQHGQNAQSVTDAPTIHKSPSCASTSGSSFIKSLNPFLPIASASNCSNGIVTTTTTQHATKALFGSTGKRTPLKQSAVTSPIGIPHDLNAKREEFLRATMKICLVVSPPTSKLQLKSKSLTHLDGLDSMVACQQSVPTTKTPIVSTNDAANTSMSKATITTQQQHQLQQSSNVSNLSGVPAAKAPFTNISQGIVTAATTFTTTTDNVASTGLTIKKKTSYLQRKKPLLTRSEVSSSEFFSVSFCTDQGVQEEEFIPATKGVTLYTALSQALKRRNLTFSQIAVTESNPSNSFLDAGSSPLASSLDENTDVENLAGHHLIVTECDANRKPLQKAASFGSRTRPPRLLSSASTEETSEAAVPGKQLKQRWSGLFGIKNPQQSQLCELLNNYTKNGVPQKTASLNFDHPDFDAALEYLDNMHKSWKDIVDNNGMNDNETRIQTAIWELVTTEVYYIHALQTVTDLFLACLEAVQEERLLIDVDQHRLFSNVRDICEANLKFWTLYLYPMVAHSVATREPLRITFFHQGFVAFASIFAPYKKYCAEQSTCQFYCKELNRNNALFTSYLAWCESQKMCNRLRLADILVRPMQRLTKYSLLLTAIRKHISDVEQSEAIDTMIHSVESFVFSVNNHLTTRQENERLKGVMARIESYDVVDTNNEHLDKMIKQYSQMFDLCAPMKGCPAHQVRHLFMEGDHKYKDNLGKADVHCFLLTDMLLVCKAIAKRGLGSLKVIRQPYLTDRLVVQQSNNILNCVYLNEFQVAITAFTLQCSEAKNWYESLKRAKMIYTRLKQGAGNWDSFRLGGGGISGTTADSLAVKKSPMNSSICSHVTSANNSHSGSVEWNDSRNISVEFDKTNSLSSEEGSMGKNLALVPLKLKINATSANTLSVQPLNHLGQSLPNLTLNHSHTNLYYTYSNNTLLVPGTTTSHSGNVLLSPSHRGISYPPPSPTRVPLRRGMAFSTSTKNPPLLKSRNITSQNSINWPQLQTPPTAANLQQLHNASVNATLMRNATSAVSSQISGGQFSIPKYQAINESTKSAGTELRATQPSRDNVTDNICQKQQQQQQQQQQNAQQLSTCNETDV